MIVPDPSVMNAPHAVVGIFLLQDLEEPVPVFHLLVAAMVLGPIRHEIELVGQRPPDVAIGGKPGDAVPQIAVVLRVAHVGKSPAVVGVPENQVGLDIQPLQVQDSLFDVMPKGGIWAVEIELAVGLLLKRKQLRFVLVVGIGLGKHTEADFVEGRRGQGFERLLLQLGGLMNPGVTCRPELMIRHAVAVAQVERAEDLDRSMVVRRRRSGSERAALAVQLRAVAPRFILPLALCGRRETDFVDAVAVVEAGDGNAAIAAADGSGQLHFEIRVAVTRAVQRRLPHAPLFGVSSMNTAGDTA